MDLRHRHYTERPLVKSKIVATVGPACESQETLQRLVEGGVDLFRLNFAHGRKDWLEEILASIRAVSAEMQRPIGTLADLTGPKIRLGELNEEPLDCREGDRFTFAREPVPGDPAVLTSTYEQLIDDLMPGDRVLLADGTIAMRIVEKDAGAGRAVCEVEHPGLLRSRQGINLPGVELSTPSLTDRDREDLAWAVQNGVDFVGLSFVRRAEDIQNLRSVIEELQPPIPPQIVAKIEKTEAVNDIERILDETDAVMVARGDLGVEVDIARVPTLQKRLIRLCNQHRIPVITATQMLDSMQQNEHPTRAEASDVTNAILDGSDAVMLSGETAIGKYPIHAVAMMSRIASEAERLVTASPESDSHSAPRTRATLITESVTLAAGTAAENLDADLIVVASHSGRTAMAASKQRSRVPILGMSDRADTARRMCLYWGVTPIQTDAVHEPPRKLLKFVTDWGKRHGILGSGSRLVLIAGTDWSEEKHNMMLVHVVP